MKSDIDIIKTFYKSFRCTCSSKFSDYLKNNNYGCILLSSKQKKCPIATVCNKMYNQGGNKDYTILAFNRRKFCWTMLKIDKMKEILK